MGYDIVLRLMLSRTFAVIREFSEIGEKLMSDYSVVAPMLFGWQYHLQRLSRGFLITCKGLEESGIGRVGENPFEGSASYVPISTMAARIEIDMREIMNESSDRIPRSYLVDGV